MKHEQMQSRFCLTLSNRPESVELAGSCAAKVARSLGFASRAVTQFRQAVEEAADNVVRHAYRSDEDALFNVDCWEVPLGIRVTVKDHGVPFLPEEGCSKHQHGWERMASLVDQLSFHNLGRDGKEVELLRFRHDENLHHHFTKEELQPKLDDQEDSEFDKEFVIRPTTKKEVFGVCKSVYQTYGYTYDHEVVYYPERFMEMIEQGLLVSLVAVTKSGQVVGHVGLSLERPSSPIANLGMAVVDPICRGLGLANKLADVAIEKAKQLGLTGLFGMAVTTHTYSQKVMHRAGFHDCAVLLGFTPESIAFHGINDHVGQRETLVMMYLQLKENKPAPVYPPAEHREEIERILKNIRPDFTLSGPPDEVKLPIESSTRVVITQESGQATIEVQTLGEDAAERVCESLRQLKLQRIDIITAKLDLHSPGLPWLVPQMESFGFFFAGVLPEWRGEGALLMSYLNNVDLDIEQLKLDGREGTDILKYVQECHQKAQVIYSPA